MVGGWFFNEEARRGAEGAEHLALHPADEPADLAFEDVGFGEDVLNRAREGGGEDLVVAGAAQGEGPAGDGVGLHAVGWWRAGGFMVVLSFILEYAGAGGLSAMVENQPLTPGAFSHREGFAAFDFCGERTQFLFLLFGHEA